MRKAGFTLIELLIVVVILGILAAVAGAQVTRARDQAYVATLKTDLENLIKLEELFMIANGRYGAVNELTGWTPSRHVTITIAPLKLRAYAVQAEHSALPDWYCGYYTPNAPEGRGKPADQPETIACAKRP